MSKARYILELFLQESELPKIGYRIGNKHTPSEPFLSTAKKIAEFLERVGIMRVFESKSSWGELSVVGYAHNPDITVKEIDYNNKDFHKYMLYVVKPKSPDVISKLSKKYGFAGKRDSDLKLEGSLEVWNSVMKNESEFKKFIDKLAIKIPTLSIDNTKINTVNSTGNNPVSSALPPVKKEPDSNKAKLAKVDKDLLGIIKEKLKVFDFSNPIICLIQTESGFKSTDENGELYDADEEMNVYVSFKGYDKAGFVENSSFEFLATPYKYPDGSVLYSPRFFEDEVEEALKAYIPGIKIVYKTQDFDYPDVVYDRRKK